MLEFVLNPRDRKLRLAAVGVCRGFLDFLDDERLAGHVTDLHRKAAEAALGVAERFADGTATEEEQEEARKSVHALAEELLTIADPLLLSVDADGTSMRLYDAGNL